MLSLPNLCFLAHAASVADSFNLAGRSCDIRWLSILGLCLNFVGALLILLHSFRTTGATTPADQQFLASPWWYRTGLASLTLGFILQLVALLL